MKRMILSFAVILTALLFCLAAESVSILSHRARRMSPVWFSQIMPYTTSSSQSTEKTTAHRLSK